MSVFIAIDTGRFTESIGSWRSRLGKWAGIRAVAESPGAGDETVTFHSGREWLTHRWILLPQTSSQCASSPRHPLVCARPSSRGPYSAKCGGCQGLGRRGAGTLHPAGERHPGRHQNRGPLWSPFAASLGRTKEQKTLVVIDLYVFVSKSSFHLYLLEKKWKIGIVQKNKLL